MFTALVSHSLASCPHRPPCPGCPRFGEPLATHPSLVPLKEFAREHGVTLELAGGDPSQMSQPIGHRLRARLAVRGRAPVPRIGIFERGSHYVVDMPECLIHHPRINQAVASLRAALVRTVTTLYAERSHNGLVRYVQLVVERGEHREHARVQIVLVGNCEQKEPLASLIDALRQELGDELHGIFFSANTARGNAILGPSCELVAGLPAIEENIAGARVFFPPDAFGQQNLDAYEAVVQRLSAIVPEGADVLELYAGVGAIGLSLLSRASRVRFNELSRGSLQGLQQGLDVLPPELRARTEVLAGSAAEHAGQVASLASPAVVIADPPRKGLDPKLVEALVAAPPSRFIYLSCNPDTFLRDARAITAGALRLTQLKVEDFFPFSEHVETLSVFDR